jgi:hypothetical protein
MESIHMTEETYQPIATKVGVLYGRSSFFLDDIFYDGFEHTLTLRGDVSTDRVDVPGVDDLRYYLRFDYVFAFQVIEFDSWCHQSGTRGESSFDEVFNSRWQKELGGKVTNPTRQFIFVTYDRVIEVVCHEFVLDIFAVE